MLVVETTASTRASNAFNDQKQKSPAHIPEVRRIGSTLYTWTAPNRNICPRSVIASAVAEQGVQSWHTLPPTFILVTIPGAPHRRLAEHL